MTQQPPQELSSEAWDSHQSTPGCIGGAGGGGAADWSKYRKRPEDQTVAEAADVVGSHPAGGRTGDVCSPVQRAGSHPSSLRISFLLTIYRHEKILVVLESHLTRLDCVSVLACTV